MAEQNHTPSKESNATGDGATPERRGEHAAVQCMEVGEGRSLFERRLLLEGMEVCCRFFQLPGKKIGPFESARFGSQTGLF